MGFKVGSGNRRNPEADSDTFFKQHFRRALSEILARESWRPGPIVQTPVNKNRFPANRVSDRYEVKYTTENPIQLPVTPIAEYELMNINGRNSYFGPNMSS